MTTLTREKIKALREAARKATPGPWTSKRSSRPVDGEWPGGFEDQSVDPLEFRPNERARQVALAVLSAALSAGGQSG